MSLHGLAALLLLVVPSASPSPSASPAGGFVHRIEGGLPLTRADILAAAREVMTAARYCALVTRGPEGDAEARVVDAFPPDEGMSVRIATNPLTRKVEQIRRDPRVTLFYFDPRSMSAVTLVGRAEVVTDPGEKTRWWKAEWAGLYQADNHGDDYVLLRFVPARLEIVGHGMVSDPKTWRPVSLDLR